MRQRAHCWILVVGLVVTGLLGASLGAHTSLVGGYRLDEGTGLVAADYSGHNLHGTLTNGPVWVAGRANGALQFDGVDDYVELGNPPQLNPTTALTIIAWIKPAIVSRAQFIVAKDNLPAPGKLQYFLRQQGTGLRMGVQTDRDYYANSAANVFVANTWYHVAGVYDGSTMRVYVNGQPSGAPVSVSGAMPPNGVSARIGRRQDNQLPFTGVIDEVAIHDHAMSAAEILADYQSIANDTTAPTAAINSPAQNATLIGTVQVTASAADNVGVAGVQFRVNGSNLGNEDTAPPYQVSLDTTTLPNGPYQLTAVARDTTGNLGTSSAVNVTVSNPVPDTTPPQVSVTNPAANVRISGATTLIASATDNVAVAGVTFRIDNADVGAEVAGPNFQLVIDTRTLSDGPHVFAARARDTSNNTATSAGVTAIVDNTPPTVSNGQPSGSLPAGTTIASLQVQTNEAANCRYGTMAGLTYSAQPNALSAVFGTSHSAQLSGLQNGQSYNYYVRCQDTAGNPTPADYLVSFSVLSPPPIRAQYHFDEGAGTAISDSSGNQYNGSLLNGPTWVTGQRGSALRFDGVDDFATLSIPTGVQPDYITLAAWILPTSLDRWQGIVMKDGSPVSPQDYRFGIDTNGRLHFIVQLGTITAFHNVTAPSPLSGQTWQHVAVTYDGNIVQLYLNGQPFGSAVNVGSGVVGIGAPSPVVIGGGSFYPFAGSIDEVEIFDRALTGAEVQALFNSTLTDVTPPVATLAAPADGSTVGGIINITANVSDNLGIAGVQFRAGGANVGSEDITFPYEVALDTTTLGNGPRQLQAVARDTVGNITTSTIVVNVFNQAPDTTPPQVAITSLSPNATVSGIIPMTVNATDNVGVVSVQYQVDGLDFGPAVTAAPFSTSLDTALLPNGPHSLVAVARDAAGNTGSSPAVPFVIANVAGDLTPPVLSNGQPTGTLAAGTTQALVSLNSDEICDCRYAYTPGVLYANMTNSFPATGATAHSKLMTGLNNGQTYSYYVRCIDPVGNSNPTDYVISFTVAATSSNERALLHFDEGFGVTAADSSGSGNNGTLVNGPAWVTGHAGSALSFDGVDDYVDIGNAASLNPTTAVTLAAWIRTTGSPLSQFVIAKDSLPSGRTQYFLRVQNGTAVRMGVRTSIDNFANSAANALTPNTWYHIAGVYNGATMQVYVNGQPSGAAVAATGPMSNNGVNVRIGRRQDAALPFQGAIDDVEIYDRALTAAEILLLYTGPPQDTTPPNVSITSPALGAQISGSYPLSANASDNVGVVGVQFFVDGNAVGPEDTTAPYSVSLQTSTLPDGPHVVTARARDAAGNTATSLPINTTIANVAATIGQVSAPITMPAVAVHSVLLHTNEVLFWAGQLNGGSSAHIWNLANGSFTPVPNNFTNIFCGGQAALADGRILVVGGHDNANGILGEDDSNIYDPVTRQWSMTAPMAFRRWYGSATTMPDGKILVNGGGTTCFTCYADIPELFDPATNTYTQLPGAQLGIPFYMQMYLLPDGRVVNAASEEHKIPTRVLNVATQTWSMVDSRTLEGGSSAMYAPNKILKAGSPTPNPNNLALASAESYVIDMGAASPQWRQVASLNHPRVFHTLTVLPDGNVVVTGGSRVSSASQTQNGVLEVEMWSPQTETWTVMARAQVPRLYHSSAILLPDARVMISGSGASAGPDQKSIEIFSPPYLFRGSRPTIATAPSFAAWGSTFSVDTPEAAQIASVTLMRLGATTHGYDMNQRKVDLSFTQQTGRLTVTAPADGRVAPPGYYMLFILDTNGVPSVSKFVRIGP